jgi:O-antigen ligase
MIRLGLLYLGTSGLMVLALRYWYAALCGLVFLTVLMQHPSMPTSMFGIPGCNPWNMVFLAVFFSWLLHRPTEPPRAKVPPAAVILFSLFVFMVVAAGLAGALDHRSVQGPLAGRLTFFPVFVDAVLNPLKYLMVGVMFFDGARTEQRARWALYSAVGSGVCYALLMFKSMKQRVFTISFEDSRRLTDKLVGLYANDLAELLTFTIWAGVLVAFLLASRWRRLGWLFLAASVVPPFMALKSRAGFAAFGAVGLALGLLRWRRILILFPLMIVLTLWAAPDVVDRVMMGVDVEAAEYSWDEISAGRLTNIWPPVIEQIGRSPIIGHGRLAILRKDCYDAILEREKLVPTHPHNSYLEVLLDTGMVGLLISAACCVGLFVVHYRLLRGPRARTPANQFIGETTHVMFLDPLRHGQAIAALGGAGMAALVTELSAGLSGSSFFPSQSSVPYLCIWGAASALDAQRRVQIVRSQGEEKEGAPA